MNSQSYRSPFAHWTAGQPAGRLENGERRFSERWMVNAVQMVNAER